MKNRQLRTVITLLMFALGVFTASHSNAAFIKKAQPSAAANAPVQSDPLLEKLPSKKIAHGIKHATLKNAWSALRHMYSPEGSQGHSGNDTTAILSLAFGIGGLAAMLALFLSGGVVVLLLLWLGLSISSIVLGASALRKHQSRGMAIAGLTMGIVGTGLFLLFFALLLAILSSLK